MAYEPFSRAGTVMLFAPLPDEVDLTTFLERCRRTGRRVCAARAAWQERSMEPAEVGGVLWEQMVPIRFGLREPAADAPIIPMEAIDLVIVPETEDLRAPVVREVQEDRGRPGMVLEDGLETGHHLRGETLCRHRETDRRVVTDHQLLDLPGHQLYVVAAVVDPYVNGVHVSLLEPGEWTASDESLAERCLAGGPAALEKGELTDLLYQPQAMLHMHRSVWLRPAEGIHAVWTQAVESYRRRIDAGLPDDRHAIR